MAQVGLRNFYYVLMSIDVQDVETYGTPKKIGNAISVDISPEVETTELYGDDMAVATDVNFKEVKVSIETTEIPLEDKAVLLGQTYSSESGLIAKMTDDAPYVGLMFESRKHDGNTRCVKLMKGKFAETQETIKTRGKSLEYQVPKLEGTFVASADGTWKKVKDFAKGTDTSSWYESM